MTMRGESFDGSFFFIILNPPQLGELKYCIEGVFLGGFGVFT